MARVCVFSEPLRGVVGTLPSAAPARPEADDARSAAAAAWLTAADAFRAPATGFSEANTGVLTKISDAANERPAKRRMVIFDPPIFLPPKEKR